MIGEEIEERERRREGGRKRAEGRRGPGVTGNNNTPVYTISIVRGSISITRSMCG